MTAAVTDAQRRVMAKIADATTALIDLRLDLVDAIDELVMVTEWAGEDIPAEQKIALDKVIECRRRLAAAEADVDFLRHRLVNCAEKVRAAA